jgi:tRNA-Thr(GGU) m(6)t(6)A37 methyltransferase TsaA
LDQLSKFSHIWVVFLFDQNTNWTEALCSENEGFTFRAKIAPPRLFGKRVGVFSTRSPHRPNPVGLTVVAVDSVNEKEGIINVSGVDMTDGTPILDIKPYIPYDVVLDHRVPEWVMAEDVPHWKLCVEPPAEEALREIVAQRSTPFYSSYEDLVALLRDVLLQDPRSIHQGRGSAMDAANMVPYNCNIDDIAVEFLALEDSIKIVRAYVECRDALDHDDDGVVEKNDKSKRSEEGTGKAKDKIEENEKVDLKQSGTAEEVSDQRQ